MPSPLPDRPGLLIRDPFRFAENMVIVPAPLVPCLTFFDGRTPREHVTESLVRATGDVRMIAVVRQLKEALSDGGFLDDDVFETLRARRVRAFVEAPRREPAHAGQAYPDELPALRDTMARWLDGAGGRAGAGEVLGIAAPHVSPEGGWRCYRAAYRALGPEHADRTFVILGTSHYGSPETFGLTRKPFVTPYGDAQVATELVDELVADGGDAVRAEDYCQSVEHSIELQVVFLQHLFGPGIRIVPVLCGPFARRTLGDGRPEEDPSVGRFLEALAALSAREGARLLWVLGVDMAHVGRRYGDEFDARAGEGRLRQVADRDQARCQRLAAGDADGFWQLVQQEGDDLRWCGASPLYAFLKVVKPPAGELLHYEQWNIDEQSVVSFAGMAFRRPAA